jgi:tetratricopeptide (TPR) repeat protein
MKLRLFHFAFLFSLAVPGLAQAHDDSQSGPLGKQNILGFSYRNLKQYDLAFKHYKRAIEIDPRHRGAHEYIGETYLMAGDLAGAEKHLAALKAICLLPCEELKDLERAIAEYRGRKLSLGDDT